MKAALKEHKTRAAAAGSGRTVPTRQVHSPKLRELMTVAREEGLFRGARKKMLRGRMPEALVQKAKERTGIKSDTELIEVALANLAVADEYAEWLLSQRGTVNKDVDLEF